jgi:hypothetical protein
MEVKKVAKKKVIKQKKLPEAAKKTKDDVEFSTEFYSDKPTRHVVNAIQEMYSQAGVSEEE